MYCVYIYGFSYTQSAGDTSPAPVTEGGDKSDKPVAEKADNPTEGDSKPVATDTTDDTSAPATAIDKGLIFERSMYRWCGLITMY